jgi:hypothetical protein
MAPVRSIARDRPSLPFETVERFLAGTPGGMWTSMSGDAAGADSTSRALTVRTRARSIRRHEDTNQNLPHHDLDGLVLRLLSLG